MPAHSVEAIKRPLVAQDFTSFALSVGTVPTPIATHLQITALIDSLIISVPSTAANSVFMGGPAVTTTSGIEIIAGSPIQLIIDHEGRQIYELQDLLMDIAVGVTCRPMAAMEIPFVVFDVSTIFLIAAAATTVAIMLFKATYI